MFAKWLGRRILTRRPLILEQLEERIVFDAAVDASAQDNPDNDAGNQDVAAQSGDTAQTVGESGAADGGLTAAADSADPLSDIYNQPLNEVLISNVPEVIEGISDAADDGSGQDVRVLVVSSNLMDADELAAAAAPGVITVEYDGSADSPNAILSAIEISLAGQRADSIALATHDLGEARFVLTEGYSVSPSSLAGSVELHTFWQGVGALLADDGRVDLMVCDLASTDAGGLLISQLQTLTGHTVAASDDPVGNPDSGGDWVLETVGVDTASVYFVQSRLEAFEGILGGEDKLTVSDGATDDHFGWSVAISGDVAVVGSLCDYGGYSGAGAVYIYEKGSGGGADWILEKTLGSPDPHIDAGFGISVSVSGDYLAVGASGEGSAFLFMRNQGGDDNWGLVKELVPSVHSSADDYGRSVAVSDGCAIVGARLADYDGFTNTGIAFVFEQDRGGANNWGQTAVLTAGSDEATNNFFGASVAISSDHIIVGAPGTDVETIEDAGAAYIFDRDLGGTDHWGQEAKLVAGDPGEDDEFGTSVAISGYCAIVGAPYDTVGGKSNAGSAYTFFSDSGGTDAWGQTQKLVSSVTQTYGTWFGWSVALSGDYAVVGARSQDVGSATDAGAVSVFLRNYGGNDHWGEVVTYTASDAQSSDVLGFSVAISGTDIIAGAPNEDEQGSNAGAAYVFSGSLDVPPEIYPADAPTVITYEDSQSGVFCLKGRDANCPDTSEVYFVVQDENGVYQVIDNCGTSSIDVAHGTITFQGALERGQHSYTQAFVFTPDENYCGEFEVSYYFAGSDGTRSDTVTLQIVVNSVNDSPVILDGETPSVTVDEDDTSAVFTLTAHDADNDDISVVNFVVDGHTISNSGPSTVTVTNGVLTAWGGVVSDGSGEYTQQFTFTPNADYTGALSLTYYFKTPAPSSLSTSGQTLGSESRTCVALGDVDRDGAIDIVLGGGGGTAIWLNDGTGAFSDSGQSLSASGTESLALGDVDGDGDLDIVQGTGSNTKIWLNIGTGAFSDSGQSLASSGANALALGDVNDDGWLDIVVADSNGIKLWLNDGTGVFSKSGRSFTSGEAMTVAMGDMDGDGDLDIVSNNGGRLHVSLNNGDGWFTELTTPNPSGAYCIALDDLDGDGNLDIVEGHSGSNARIWLNDGTGAAFTSHSISDFSWTWCATTLDVNGDGHPDLLLGGRTLINDGTGTSYTVSQAIAASASLLGAASADLNGDGWDDLVTAAQNQVWLTKTKMESSSPNSVLAITVNPVNDAPVLADTEPTLTPIEPNETNSHGDTVAGIVTDGSVTDVDLSPTTSAPQAIAVTWVDNTNGYWEYSTDGGTTWTRLSDVHGSGVDISTTATLLDESDQSRIRFVPDTDWHGTAEFQYRAWDKTEGTNGGTLDATLNGGVTALSAFAETALITVNEAPALSDFDGTLHYTEGSGAQVIDSDITLTDSDSTAIVSATIQIAGNYQSGEDTLSIDSGDKPAGVTATWDRTSGTLSLVGEATLAEYESMLEHVKYTDNSNDPITLNRTVSWTVNDGFHGSAANTSTIEVIAVNNAPVLNLSHGAGGLDTTFGGDGVVITDIHPTSGNFVAFCTVIQSDGKIVVGGEDGSDFTLVRYNSDGTLDSSFGEGGIATTNVERSDRVYGLAIQSDGKIVAVGRSKDSYGGDDFSVARFNSDGSIDTTFGGGDGVIYIDNCAAQNDTAYSVAIQSDGDIVVVGRKALGSGLTDFYVVRLNEYGDYDTSFDSDGRASVNIGSHDIAYAVAVQYVEDDWKIVIAGTTGSNLALLRFNSDGSLDSAFSGDGKLTVDLGGSSDSAYSMAIQSDGRIVVAGGMGSDVAILRYNIDGSLDTAFDGDGIVTTDLGGSSESAYSVSIQSDGKIVVAGVTNASSSNDFVLMRYNIDGSLDATFNGNGIVTTDVSGGYDDTARGGAIQSDGLIVVAGYASNGTHNEFAVARYGTGGPTEYTEGDPPIVIENTIALTDVDNTDMESATIQITCAYQKGADTLGIDSGELLDGVTETWDAETGTLTLNGHASKADYEFMLEHVTYENTGDNPGDEHRTVTWTVFDGAGYSEAQTSTITVTAVSDAPEGTDNTITMVEDGTYTLTVADFGFSDVDGDAFVSATITQPPTAGTLQLYGVGVTLNQVITKADIEAGGLTFTPALNANGVGCDSFRFAVTDDGGTANGGRDTDQTPNTMTFDVTPVDDADPIAGADSFSTAEDTAMSGTIAGNDSVGADTLATWSKLTDPSNGMLVLNADGTFTYTPNADFNGTDSFTYTLTDSDGETATATASITVTPVKDAPTDISLSNGTIAENAGVNAMVGTLSATDPDTGDTFTYTLVSGEGDGGNSFFNISGDTLRANDIFDYEAGPSSYSIRVKVTDSGGMSHEEQFTINVTDVNDAPVLSDLGDTLIYSEDDSTKVIDVSITVIDEDNADMTSATIQITGSYQSAEDTLSISDADLLGGVTANWNSSAGTLTLTGSASKADYELMLEHVTYTNASDDPNTGDRTITWTVNDGAAYSVAQTSTITVTAVDDAPILNLNSGAGALDLTFSDDGFSTTDFSGSGDEGQAIAIQSDGKIVVAGYAWNGSNYDIAVVRYNSDGTLDTSFSGDGKVTTGWGNNEYAYSVAVQADGKIVVVGARVFASGSSDFAVVRYNSDGSLDTTFDGDGILVTDFDGGDDYGRSVAIDADGKIVVAGYTNTGTQYDIAVARYNNDGTLDTSFDGDGRVTTSWHNNEYAYSVAIQDDGKIVVAGFRTFYYIEGCDFALVRYNSDGSLDTTFDLDGILVTDIAGADVARSVAIQSDGKILAAGYAHPDSTDVFALVRYNSDGSLDTTFDGDGKLTTVISGGDDRAYSVAVQTDGKIVVAGYANGDFALVRYYTDGSLDTTFGGDGTVTTHMGGDDCAYSLAIQSDGKIVAAGTNSSDFALARYDASHLEYTEGDGARVIDGAITLSDVDSSTMTSATIRIVNYTSGQDVLAFTSTLEITGTWDDVNGVLTLSGPATVAAYEAALRSVTYENTSDDPSTTPRTVTWTVSDGQNDSEPQAATITIIALDSPILNLNSNAGAPDPTFNGDGIVTTDFAGNTDSGQAMTIQADGKIVVAGYAWNGSNYDIALVRYNSDGTLDTTFHYDGRVTTDLGHNEYAYSVAIDFDGKIVVAGYANGDFALVRYNSDGSLDTAFGVDGVATTDFDGSTDYGRSVAIGADGKIVVAGYRNTGTQYDIALARYNTDGSLDTTFDGDGKVITSWGNNEYAYAVAVQDDGRIVIAGTRAWYNPGTNFNFILIRYNSDGTMDTTFGGEGNGRRMDDMGGADIARSVFIQSDGKILVAGYAHPGSTDVFAIARYNSDGTLDTTFDGDGKLLTAITGGDDRAYSVAIQSDGKIVVAGYANGDFVLARYYTDGSLDTTFGGGGTITTNIGGDDCAYSVAIQSDGKIVAAGTNSYDFAVARYDASHLEYTENDGVRVIDSAITLIDLDSDYMEWATIQITGSYQIGEDMLGIADADLRGGIEAIWDAVNGILTLQGSASKEDYVYMLEHVTYTNTSDNPGTMPLTVSWIVSDGKLDSTPHASTIAVTAVNDAPVLSDLGGTLDYTDNDGWQRIDTSITLTDMDSDYMEWATVQITGNYQSGEDRLGIADVRLLSGVTASWDADTGTLTLTGTASKADYELMLEDVTYTNTSDDPSTLDRTVTWTLSDGDLDSEAQAIKISLTSVTPSLPDSGGLPPDSFLETHFEALDSMMELSPAMDKLFSFLSSAELLPEYLTPKEFSTPEFHAFAAILSEALFAEGSEARHRAWESLMHFVAEWKSLRPAEQLLGLEEFLGMLRDGQFGRTPEDILLVFNADQIHLAEWLTALMGSSNEPRYTHGEPLQGFHSFSEALAAGKALIFDLDDMRVADILTSETGGSLIVGSAGVWPQPEQLMQRVLDISQISFHDVLAS